MATYTPTTAGEITTGDKVRALAAVGPSVVKPGAEDYPWTVAHVQVLPKGRVRIWAHPYNARVSIESPSVYGNFALADAVEVAS